VRVSCRSTFLTAILVSLVSGCSGAPRKNPVRLGAVDAGPGSLEAVRRQLQGKWELVAVETFDAAGTSTTHRGDGLLTFDEFGTVTATGRLDDAPDAGNLVTFSGRAVIDTARHLIVLVPPTGTAGEHHAAAVPDPARQYLLQGSVLTLTVQDPGGHPRVRTTWHRLG
jgi:hypothetical protein